MITNPNPITTKPIAEKVYNLLYVSSLAATQSKEYGGHIIVELLPMTDDGELAPREYIQRFSCNLEQAISSVPEMAGAFSSVINAIPATIKWLEDQEQIEK